MGREDSAGGNEHSDVRREMREVDGVRCFVGRSRERCRVWLCGVRGHGRMRQRRSVTIGIGNGMQIFGILVKAYNALRAYLMLLWRMKSMDKAILICHRRIAKAYIEKCIERIH